MDEPKHTPFLVKVQSTRFIAWVFVALFCAVYLPLHLITGEQATILLGSATTLLFGVKGVQAWKGNLPI